MSPSTRRGIHIPGPRVFSIALLLASCSPDADGGPPPEVAAERAEAARNACVADELLRRAEDQLETLRVTHEQSASAGEAGDLLRQASLSAVRFAEVYRQHAELHRTVLAQIDTAFNHVRRSSDSLRHVQAAEAFTMSRPEPGTVEANALQNYLRDFRTLRSNDDHPCNWAAN